MGYKINWGMEGLDYKSKSAADGMVENCVELMVQRYPILRGRDIQFFVFDKVYLEDGRRVAGVYNPKEKIILIDGNMILWRYWDEMVVTVYHELFHMVQDKFGLFEMFKMDKEAVEIVESRARAFTRKLMDRE
jgi:hypothetical protein